MNGILASNACAIIYVRCTSTMKFMMLIAQWTHIRKKHPEVENIEELKETIGKPDKITNIHVDETIYYYYKFYKQIPPPNRFLLVVVKYLNSEGFIITAYYEDKIK